MITQEQIEQAAREALNGKYCGAIRSLEYGLMIEMFKSGAEWKHRQMLDGASDGFDRWVTSMEYADNDPYMKESWQASRLGAEKQIEEMKLDLQWALSGQPRQLPEFMRRKKEILSKWGH